MSGSPGLAWRGRERSLARVAVLFAVTAGAYWPLWLAQIVPSPRGGAHGRRARIAIVVAALIPGVNLVLEVLLALLLPRTVRSTARRHSARPRRTPKRRRSCCSPPPPSRSRSRSRSACRRLARRVPRLAARAPGRARGPARLQPLRACRPPRHLRAAGTASSSSAAGSARHSCSELSSRSSGAREQKTSTPASTPPVERASDVAVRPGALWVTLIEDNAVEQVDRRTLRPTGQRVRVGRSPYDIAPGFGELWVADYRSDSVSRIDPRTVKVKGPPIPTGRGPFGVAVGYGSVWVTNEVDRNLVEIDPGTNRVRRKITVGPGPHGVAVGEGAVWVAGAASSSVVRVDPRSGAKTPNPDARPLSRRGGRGRKRLGGAAAGALGRAHRPGSRAKSRRPDLSWPRAGEHRLRPRLGLGRERHRGNRDANRCSYGRTWSAAHAKSEASSATSR